MKTSKVVWFEEYKHCGCVSEYVDRKKDLLGYCPKHGTDRAHAHKVLKEE